MKLENIKLNIDTELVLNVGDPINKTNAPRCYNKLFERLNMNAIMLPCKIKRGCLPQLLDACHLLGIHYLCPTMPHKGDFVEILDDVDEISQLFRSVNAVRLDEKGSHGKGLDGKGAVRAMINGGTRLKGINALIYGAGGISGVTSYELAQQKVKKIYIANRTEEKADAIATILRNHSGVEAEVIGTDKDSLDKAAQECELFANLTPLGMNGFPYKHDYLGFIDHLPNTATVFDCVINPPLSETIEAGKKNELNTIPGMQMLVAQMDLIFDFLFGRKVLAEDKEACIKELCNFLNIQSGNSKNG